MGELAEYLRAARCKKGLSHAQLAEQLGCSITDRPACRRGKIPPARDTVDGYIRVCVLDHTQAEGLWSKAVNLRCGRTLRSYTQAPRPDLVRTADELGAALAPVWEQNGRPSTREMERRAEGRYKETRASLSRSTAERISRRKSLPGSERTPRAYLVACEAPEAKFPMWVQAWGRVQGRRRAVREREHREARRVIRRQALRGRFHSQCPCISQFLRRRTVVRARPWKSSVSAGLVGLRMGGKAT